jgi:hypothetical protein
MKNGELLKAAEREGFEVLVTTDKNLKYQQNLGTRRIAIIILSTTSWPRIKCDIRVVVCAINNATSGSYKEVMISQSGR